jgi:hypothetical protein
MEEFTEWIKRGKRENKKRLNSEQKEAKERMKEEDKAKKR